MPVDKFAAAIHNVMANEGGFVDDPSDNGGETNFGISKAQFPDVDVRNLTKDEAVAIYKEKYWGLYPCEDMPVEVAVVFLDCIVNHGPREPIMWLQGAIGAVADGNLGPKTMAALAKAKSAVDVARDMTLSRRDYVEQLHNYDHFKSGWNRRQLDTLIAAVSEGFIDASE